jgi:hypothetical protein
LLALECNQYHGVPQITWREPYDRGTRQKLGQVRQGSGTTPTLMGTQFVANADNAAPHLHVLVYRRSAEVAGSRLVCAVPVFLPRCSATENSFIATERSIIVENNYGCSGLGATMRGRTTEPDITRVDLDADEQGCHIVCTNLESVPNVVSQLSLATGLMYTKDPGPDSTDAWYVTAADFATGATVFKRLAGTGFLYNSNYASVYLGLDGTCYVGVVGGLVAIRAQD